MLIWSYRKRYLDEMDTYSSEFHIMENLMLDSITKII